MKVSSGLILNTIDALMQHELEGPRRAGQPVFDIDPLHKTPAGELDRVAGRTATGVGTLRELPRTQALAVGGRVGWGTEPTPNRQGGD